MQEVHHDSLNVGRNAVKNKSHILLALIICSSRNDTKVDKFQIWGKRFCKCVNMPTQESQTGCSDTWRTEMKKELNADEQSKCWALIEKQNCNE